MRSLKSSILSITSSLVDKTFWGVVRSTLGRLGLWGVHWDKLSPWPGACSSPLEATIKNNIRRVFYIEINSIIKFKIWRSDELWSILPKIIDSSKALQCLKTLRRKRWRIVWEQVKNNSKEYSLKSPLLVSKHQAYCALTILAHFSWTKDSILIIIWSFVRSSWTKLYSEI